MVKQTRNFAFCLAFIALTARPALCYETEKVDVWKAGDDGYKIFRIPGIVVTSKGTVLAYAEARTSDRGDWNAIDIVMRRSTDGGKTWSTSRKIADVEGPKRKNPVAVAQNLAPSNEVTYNNPVAIPDSNGTVHFVFCLEYMRAFYTRSTNDGVTWSKPVEITAAFDRFRPEYDWKVLATGPGHGIQLTSGRLLIPVWLSTGTGGHAHRPSVTSVIYSDDHGKIWQRGEIAIPNTSEFINPNETAAVQLADGRVMLNARSESKQRLRLITTSNDGVTGWSTPQFDESLIEPICMAGFARSGDYLLFSNPLSTERKNVTLQISRNSGKTWQIQETIDPGWSAYSDIAVARDSTILLLYERGRPAEALTLTRLKGILK